ncbi:MAG TPA: DUF5050 domain-containing protein [Candidatus Acidoferrum sp.]|nr:DUF5050 domain-containing protein [Candidatus Acidoferrum sp.]
MNRKWLIFLTLAISLSVLTGCQLSQTEAEPPADGQAGEVIGIKGTEFAVDEDGNAYYSHDGKMFRRDINGQEKMFTDRGILIFIKDDWVYYMDYSTRIFKMKTDGSDKVLLTDRDTGAGLMLIGDSIYSADGDDGDSIFRMDTNGENLQAVNSHDCNRFVGYQDEWLYYIRDNDEYKKNKETMKEFSLYRVRADGSEVTLISDYDSPYIFIDGDSIYYYIDSLDGYAEDVYRTDLDGGNLTQLHLLPQDSELPYEVVIKDGWVYYSHFTGGFYDGSDLHRVRADGTGDEMIFAGLIKDVQFSGGWMFCFDEETKYWYKLRPDGTERGQLYPDSMMVMGPGI